MRTFGVVRKMTALMAVMERFDLRIIGRGGHSAMPHLCLDALEVGTQVVNALQRIVSRQMDPLRPSVVTIGSFHAGETFNVIPGEALMCGTTRTFDRFIWNAWPERIEQIVRGVCESMGATIDGVYLTMGRYDLILIMDAPNPEIVAKIILTTASKGSISTETLPAFAEEEYRKIFSELA